MDAVLDRNLKGSQKEQQKTLAGSQRGSLHIDGSQPLYGGVIGQMFLFLCLGHS